MTLRSSHLLTALLALLMAVPAIAAEAVLPTVVDGAVVWSPEAPFAQATLTVTSPSGVTLRRAFAAGETVRLHPSEVDHVPMADGFYEYQLVLASEIPVEGRDVHAVSQTGTLEVRDGVAVFSEVMVVVHAEDTVIQGSLCVGMDCAASESFGFDTVRLKENNLRIHFDDTSNSASFPANDWRITINGTDNGDPSYFAIDDATANRQIFRLSAGAPANALTVDANGDLGIGKDDAVVEVHVADGDTPTFRLEQDGSSGFGLQTWDVAGNETNFFIRDVTNSSTLPFKVRPGAANDQVVINNQGVSVNKANAATGVNLDVEGVANVSDRLLVGFDDFSTAAANTNFEVGDANGGIVRFRTNMRVDGSLLFFDDFSADPFVFRVVNSATAPVTRLMQLTNSGDLDISGTLTQGSDVHIKENILPVDPADILAGVASLPISTWEYIADQSDAVHLGPMSQDFAAAFGLGHDDTRIASVDADGVALAAIQALLVRLEAAEAENAALTARLARIETLLAETHE